MKEFRIHFEEKSWEDLRRRIDRTRMPQEFSAAGPEMGTDERELAALLDRWRDGYDWTRREAALNQYPQFTCGLDGVTVHFFYIRSARPGALPLLGKIAVPTAIAAFPKNVLPPPREWVERNYPVVRYTKMPRGGHFTALEQPEAFAADLSQFLHTLAGTAARLLALKL